MTMHKVFISYYHKDDNKYRKKFEESFGHLFISKSVESGEIDTDVSDEYVKRLIREEYITDTSVLIFLVGPKTYCRKHVDWEISAGLSKKAGGYSGLLGLMLPTHPNFREKYDPNTIPKRFYDNIKSGFSDFYYWSENEDNIKKWIEFWGLDELKYNKRKEIKKSFYKKNKKNLIEPTDKDVENLGDIMPIKLRPFLPPTFSFD